MATKNCPRCSKQVPVACKKCGCGHTFFASRKGSSSSTGGGSSHAPSTASTANPWKSDEDDLAPFRRRTGRVQREKPNFYDALEYENEIRKQKQLLRKAAKATRTEEEQPEQVEEETVPKKRRGRPPGLGVKKPQTTSSGRIQITGPKPPKVPDDGEKVQEAEEIMAGISAEKALQYNIILGEINRKWAMASWEIS